MNFDFDDEQVMLRDSLRAFLSDHYGFEKRREIVSSENGHDPAIWQSLANELGILGASLPEEAGGLGGGAVENMIVAEELGRVLAVEPWVRAIVMAGTLLRGAGGVADEILAAVAKGEELVIPGLDRPDLGSDVAVERSGESYLLSGHLAFVRAGQRATQLLVLAQGGLYLVPVDAPGVAVRGFRTVDGQGAADIELSQVRVPAAHQIAQGDDAARRCELALDAGVASLCAEALGIQRHLLETTVEYAKQRKQFGRPIGEFQVLQHRMADMFMKVEESASMTYVASMRLDAPADERALSISAAKVAIDQAGRFIGQAAVHLHGGMGITKELPVADYFARMTSITQELGSTEFHLQRYEKVSLGASMACTAA